MSRPASRALGRGLASLIPDSAFEDGPAAPESSLRRVPVDAVRSNPEQPRDHFDEGDLEALVTSIRQHGVLSPLVVRKQEGRYYLIAGERRLRAAVRAGLTEVPVVVREAGSPALQLELALVENLQRADLDPVEAARGYQRLIDEFGCTQAEVADRVGRDRSTVANAVRLLQLPDFVLELLREGSISAGHARALLPVEAAADQRRLAARILDEDLSVRATERLVRAWLDGSRDARAAERRRREAAVGHASQVLTRALSAAVAIKPRKAGGGRIVIEYGDPEQLDHLVERLRRS